MDLEKYPKIFKKSHKNSNFLEQFYKFEKKIRICYNNVKNVPILNTVILMTKELL
jgi:hypothetical protein